ncbi:hypothetical protein BASA60_000843 [Batrachochytrium salamandrivorans]|nr:hypothetical protein BASA60_000843 [Batrachochytrium salamandrivorans]
MRLSTGIILSILSANVFAIEHPNDVHSSSLLARRAVMADTDGVFLQKRGDDEGKKKRTKSKHLSVSNSGKGGHVYTKLTSKDDSDSESNSNDGDEEDSTNLTAHLLDKDGGATGGSEGVHTTVGSDQEESGFVDVIGGLPYQLFKYFKKKLTRENSEPGLIPASTYNFQLQPSQSLILSTHSVWTSYQQFRNHDSDCWGRALDPGVENVYTWLRGGVLNGEADLDQRWLDGTVEHESMGTRHDNRALAARLADFLQVAYQQYQSILWKYHLGSPC